MKKELYLIRHGMSTANQLGIIQGHDDFPLAGEGIRQSRLLQQYFIREGIRFDLAFASDLKRASETASIALAGLDICCCSELREMGLGVWEGRKISEVNADSEQWERWLNRPTQIEIEGSENMECAQQRVFSFIDGICRNRSFTRAAFFTHGGVICLFLAGITGSHLDLTWKFGHQNSAFSVVEFDSSYSLLGFNLQPHLESA
ncbi:MAG: histidine phosphatase family protein [Candidatus Wallbacteria bacterium]|nr:histidine phosphatase family protein [Candidatus Wallbacteria bacterium]